MHVEDSAMAARVGRWYGAVCQYECTDSLCRLGEILLAFASGVLTMVTFGTPYWLEKLSEAADLDSEEFHQGLWQRCTFLESCKSLPVRATSVPGELSMSVTVLVRARLPCREGRDWGVNSLP